MVKKKFPENVLVIAPEGIGDAVLSFPGLQIFRQENPDAEITIMAEANLEPFWRMCPAVNFFQCLEPIAWGRSRLLHSEKKSKFLMRSTAPLRHRLSMVGKLKHERYDRVYILRDSFRAVLIPWRAGIARRIGFSGHWRRLLLTEIVHRPEGHRQFELMKILGVQGDPPAPDVAVPRDGFQTLERKLTHFPNIGRKLTVLFQALDEERPMGARPVIALLPGGSGECWPVAHFGLLAKNLASSLNALVLLGGDAIDATVCAEVAAVAGADRVVNLAGQTTILEWAALLAVSDCVVSNAGGGAQLAAALGTPVVPVCGLADPAKTAPLGKYTRFDEKKATAAEPEFEEVIRTLVAVTTDLAYGAVAKIVHSR